MSKLYYVLFILRSQHIRCIILRLRDCFFPLCLFMCILKWSVSFFPPSNFTDRRVLITCRVGLLRLLRLSDATPKKKKSFHTGKFGPIYACWPKKGVLTWVCGSLPTTIRTSTPNDDRIGRCPTTETSSSFARVALPRIVSSWP